MTLGKVQEWTLVNGDTGLSHPLHIHINHFQVRIDFTMVLKGSGESPLNY